MKKNLLTVIILTISVINTVLLALLLFVIVPTSNKTNNLVSKVAQIVNLELESEKKDNVSIADIKNHKIANKLTIKLKSNGSGKGNNYAQFYMSLSMNNKHEDTERLQPKIIDNESFIEEIATNEFAKYTVDEVDVKKAEITDNILKDIQDLFGSDFIINISFGNIILE